MTPWLLFPVSFVLGTGFWLFANEWLGVSEPWDAPGFAVFYGMALIVSFGLGLLTAERAWLVGGAFVFAMWPIMIVGSGLGPLIAVGLILVFGLALIAALVAEFGLHIRRRIGEATN